MKRFDEITDRIYKVLEMSKFYAEVIDSVDSDNECTTHQEEWDFISFDYDEISEAIGRELDEAARDLMIDYEDYIPEDAIKVKADHIIDFIASEYADEISYRINVWHDLDGFNR